MLLQTSFMENKEALNYYKDEGIIKSITRQMMHQLVDHLPSDIADSMETIELEDGTVKMTIGMVVLSTNTLLKVKELLKEIEQLLPAGSKGLGREVYELILRTDEKDKEKTE